MNCTNPTRATLLIALPFYRLTVISLIFFLILVVYNIGMFIISLLCTWYQRTLNAGKLTEKVLKLFIATGKDEVLLMIQALNIKHILTPVLPTS